MIKRFIDEEVNSIKHDLDGLTLAKAIIRLQELAAVHGDHATLDIGQESEPYSDYEYAYIRVKVKRLETDEEYAKRRAEEQAYEDRRMKADMEAYERVKARLESK